LFVEGVAECRIEMGFSSLFVHSDWSGEKRKENGFPSCLEAVFVCGCHQVKLSPLERRAKECRCSRVPSLGTSAARSALLCSR